MEDIFITLDTDKEPYIKKLAGDRIINLTGQSGSGKTTYANEYFNTDDYLIIDTDEIFSEHRFNHTTGINKELGIYFRFKYNPLPNCGDNFDLIYQEIINYCQKYDKTIVIDCAQFHCIKDPSLLRGTIIVIRTCINNCYNRTIERYKKLYPNHTEEELENYKERKKAIFQWYKQTNEFLEKISKIEEEVSTWKMQV
jgi:shikimate kinase